ncbi:MAG: SDR family oxidoreductase [Paracoccaceae bacterium]|nr:SDR family oxidoreductase [Paracoccaceae bacterium]
MDLKDKTAIVTGAGRGIGAAIARRFAAEGARVVVADLDANAAQAVAAEFGGLAVPCDVTDEAQVQDLVARAEAQFGPVDLFCSNAGVFFGEPDHAASASNDVWQRCWGIHVMAQVYAARAVLPGMIARGEGYLLHMASAAGLLSQIGDAAYSATKHAAVGFAESLAISHGDQGIRVSVICPQYVATPMLGYDEAAEVTQGLLTPDAVADCVVEGIAQEQFLILTHPEVTQYIRFKSENYDKWLTNMRRLRRSVLDPDGRFDLQAMLRGESARK